MILHKKLRVVISYVTYLRGAIFATIYIEKNLVANEGEQIMEREELICALTKDFGLFSPLDSGLPFLVKFVELL